MEWGFRVALLALLALWLVATLRRGHIVAFGEWQLRRNEQPVAFWIATSALAGVVAAISIVLLTEAWGLG